MTNTRPLLIPNLASCSPATNMARLPLLIAARYRLASDVEVHSWSFGQVKAPRNLSAQGWEECRATLDDQAIFGPLRDFECACGKYRGAKHQRMICDRCGVKVTAITSRRQRFGHIDLPEPIVHPLGQAEQRIGAIPVLPAAIVESTAGEKLGAIYDDLAKASYSEPPNRFADSFERLVSLLLPVVLITHEWNLQESEILARGMALVPVAAARISCAFYGYPLEGLDSTVCPGCGKKTS